MASLTLVDILDTYDTVRANPTDVPKRGIRGAAGGVYVGPILSKAAIEPPTSITHATGAAAGGVDGSTGYRKTAAWDASGGSGDPTGSGDAVDIDQTRPTGRTAYTADGVFGGSTPGYPAQRVGQRASAAEYENVTGAFIDRRSVTHESVPVGSLRETTVDVETVTTVLPPPTFGTTNPAAGVVGVIDGSSAIDIDLHADDITGGANGRKGIEIAIFERGSDTDEDGTLLAHKSADGGTDATEVLAVSAGTYAVYARFRKADANGKIQVGPWSARGTIEVA